MRVLVAPDKLKGSLSASQAAAAMARGVERFGRSVAEQLPLADGGEGTLDALMNARGGTLHRVRVRDARGRPVEARIGVLDQGRTAVVESADAIGLARLAPQDRRALDATSFGVGELVRAALDLGARRIVVALGGSATNDGGAGALQALGAVLRGAPCPACARDLTNVSAVDVSAMDPRLSTIELVALCDVDSPLTGPEGATRVFGPQKGLDPSDTLPLDRALDRFASHFNFDPRALGAGAAGGLGFGLAAAAGGRLVGGADYVLDSVAFDERAARADLVLTAEGRLDAQSLAGKLVVRLGQRAARLGIPVVALAGRLDVDRTALAQHGIVAAHELSSRDTPESESMARASELLERAAERAVRDFDT